MSQVESIQNRTKEEKEAIREEWKRSGLSKKEFCKQKDISYQTFIWWFAAESRREKNRAKSKFVPVSVALSETGISTEIHLSNSRKVIFHGSVSAEMIQAVLRC